MPLRAEAADSGWQWLLKSGLKMQLA